MDPAQEELERRSRYLSSLVRRTRLHDPPQPEPEPEPELKVERKPAAEPSGGEGKAVKAEAKDNREAKVKGGAASGEGRKVAVRVRAADMPLPLQRRAIWIAREVVLSTPRLESKRLALALKKGLCYLRGKPYIDRSDDGGALASFPPRGMSLGGVHGLEGPADNIFGGAVFHLTHRRRGAVEPRHLMCVDGLAQEDGAV